MSPKPDEPSNGLRRGLATSCGMGCGLLDTVALLAAHHEKSTLAVAAKVLSIALSQARDLLAKEDAGD